MNYDIQIRCPLKLTTSYYDVEIHETFRFQVENMIPRHKYPISSGPPFSNIAIMKTKIWWHYHDG